MQIVGITSACIDADSPDADTQQQSAAALQQELEWGIHLGLQACIIPLPCRLGNANFAQVISQVRSKGHVLTARVSSCAFQNNTHQDPHCHV